MAIIRLCRTFPRISHPGIGLNCYYLSHYIDKETLVLTKRMSSPPLSVPPNVKLIEIGYSDISFGKENESLIRLFLIILSKIWGEVVFSCAVFCILRRQKVHIDILHLHSINYLFTAVLLKWIFKAPLVMNFGGTDLVRLRNSFLLRWVAGRADRALCVASSMKPDLFDIFGSTRVIYMGNGVDLSQFQGQRMVRKPQFLAIGNLRWQKGYNSLLDAFCRLVEEEPEYRLLIAGDGEERYALQKQIDSLGLRKHVFLLGMCGREKLVNLLNESRSLVMSSVSEGFPKVLIEAIACGTPVVVTDVGECRKIADSVGLVVPPNDADAMKEALLTIIRDPAQTNGFAENCLSERQKYDWYSVATRVLRAYDEVL